MTTSNPHNADIDSLPALPRDEAGPVFQAPWEAQAFAMTLELHRRGVFTWREWVDALAGEIAHGRRDRGWDDGSHYYERWLAALEKLVAVKNVVRETEMALRVDEWSDAVRSTPHGKPIVLRRS